MLSDLGGVKQGGLLEHKLCSLCIVGLYTKVMFLFYTDVLNPFCFTFVFSRMLHSYGTKKTRNLESRLLTKSHKINTNVGS